MVAPVPGLGRLCWLVVVVSVLLLAGCSGTPRTPPPRPANRLARWTAAKARWGGRPLLLGHRGGQERGYQNSMAAFGDAITLGLDYIETDVRHSADGVAVLQHDPRLPPTCDRYRGHAVRALTAAELATVRCGGQPIVTLAQLVQRLQQSDARRTGLMAEVKDVDPLGVRQAVAPLGWARVIIESFHWSYLARIEATDPRVVTCPLGVSLLTLRRALAVTHDCVGPDEQQATPVLVAAAHAAGVGVIAWTVDDPQQAIALADRQVDGIITDRPRLLASPVRLLRAPPSRAAAGESLRRRCLRRPAHPLRPTPAAGPARRRG